MRSHPRVIAPALAVAALAFAGCGGGGGGGNEADYVKTYQGACKAVTDAMQKFQTDVTSAASGGDQAKALTAIKSGATQLFDTFGKQIRVMADAKAPDEFSDFQDSVSDGADKAVKGVDDVKAEIAKVKTLQEFSGLSGKISKIDLGNSKDLPKALGEKAPACQGLSGSSS